MARDFPFQRIVRRSDRYGDRTLANGEHFGAPTGRAKHGDYFPALKYLQPQQQLPTNRTTGAEAALSSAGPVADTSKYLSVVQLTAKEKCAKQMAWRANLKTAGRCKDYFARAPYAVNDFCSGVLLIGIRCSKSRMNLASVLLMSLDLAVWADMIIGDYKYLFDPFVKLQRFDTGRSFYWLMTIN